MYHFYVKEHAKMYSDSKRTKQVSSYVSVHKFRKNYLVVITVYVLVRLNVLIRDNKRSLFYFLNYEKSSKII